ncbi:MULTISPECIES: response regulator [unclassified Pseudomonas]|uniref:hybrid sensor histidine kinase/response regulator n=1 Tax=unclassified Pseudomonas TaxID=196821 RepID=UPI000C87A1CF|nr:MULTISPECIES: response regulator [unclassified Pseudomonas]PMU10861.1 hybrid sensor histidine kinase/response regulator [Pseudomonas sp. FW305-20]PMU20523.1 hybrid sensor histidine kinase/response regulator [Pseudomonas sp. FW305-122]PMU40032.1 hybrid sensor histidine kinase/response regulator [Pseudomonas sp. FW305-47B]PMX63448.1 hybrid sensor histidine kinase/response regulator [Pseudomonas sp. FW305-33]PMX66527.1 hybrid sensor histidine kinase/response regulator [Pseudomonas sp. FW305-60
MDIKFTNRLSYKQARLTVLVGFILGTLLSLLQIGIDYASEDASINREILSLLEISHNPASRIAYNIDAELAQELTLGLLRSPAIIGAQLIDNNSTVLANVKRPGVQSGYRVISDFLFGANRQFEDRLYLDHLPTESLGILRLDVDTYSFGNRFLRRAEVTLLNGFARSLLLTGILLALFYVMLTKPLVRVIRELSSRDPRSAESTSLECPTDHENDEIGVLVKVANQQFENIATEIQQRRNAENRLTDYLGQLENIVSARTAELKAINSRLSQSNEELEVARSTALDMAEARSVFLANMSHEIRTPLNGLLGMIALSLDGPLNAEQQQQLSIAHDSGKVLVELLNDILDLSKFDAGQLELEHIPFDLGSLIEDTANLLSQNAAPSVELSCLIDPQFPALVLGDPTRVRQIVSNLLSNALKFTRFGRVDVRLSTFEDGVRIEVCDTGIGIAQDAQVKIFQPFTQAGAGITRQFGGTGLGLALTYNLCEAMQGRLTISSEAGFGSQFCADLPLPSHTRALPPASLRGKVIAITAASSGLAELLNSVLPGWGLDYEQRSIDDSLLGVNPDVLITDCPECLFGLRPSCTAPILLVTAYGSFMPSEEALALAPLQQQARPLARNALYQTLRRTLQPELSTINGARLDVLSPQRRGRVLLVEDNPVNQLVAKGMLGKLGCEVIVAGHGGEALDQLEQSEFDLVLMDCNMPVMDGYEASRQIRRSGRWPQLPIVALTANAMSEERERCRAAGMSDYLAKPFRREELAALLDLWIPTTTVL